MPFYVYGIILSAISVGFYFYDMSNTTIQDKPFKQFFKFMVSLSSGWLIVAAAFGGGVNALSRETNTAEWLLLIIYFVFVPIFFIGFNMMLYHLFDSRR